MTSPAGLRVGIATPSVAPVGGTELYVRSLLAVHRELGIHTTVYTADEGPEFECEGARVAPSGDALSESLNPLRSRQASPLAEALGRRIAASCDLLQLHRVTPRALLRCLSGRLPLAAFLHTPELTCPAKGRYLPASRMPCSKPPGAECLAVHATQRCLATPDGAQFPHAQRLRVLVHAGDARAALALCDHAVFNSRALLELFTATLGTPPASHVLPPPLEAAAAHESPRMPGRVLFVGRLQAVKGTLDAMAACAAIPGADLLVVGDGPLMPSLRQAAASMAARVRFAGWLERDAVAAEMSRAACVLVPSRWYEAWGMVGPEAIARGCRVVAFDTGGIREWCRAPWGKVVPCGNVEALIAATREALSQATPEDERAEWSRAAFELWGPAAFRASYSAILGKIMAGRSASP